VNKLFAKLSNIKQRQQPKNGIDQKAETILDTIFGANEMQTEVDRRVKEKVNMNYDDISKRKETLLSDNQIKDICKQIMRRNKKKEITGEKYPKLLNQLDDCRMRLLLTDGIPDEVDKPRKQNLPRIQRNEDDSQKITVTPEHHKLKNDKTIKRPVEGIIEVTIPSQKVPIEKPKLTKKRQRPSSRRYPNKSKAKKPQSKTKIGKYDRIQSKIKHLIKHDKQGPMQKLKKMETEIMIQSKWNNKRTTT
jgi:hypothetical protein